VSWTASPFGVAVTRRVDGEVLFNSTPSTALEFRAMIVRVALLYLFSLYLSLYLSLSLCVLTD
jgi:hypothetical protein